MLDSLVQELDTYTQDDFHVANLAMQVRVFYRLYEQGHISKQVFFNQIQNIINAQVDRNNNNEIGDKIKLDSFLYRFKEWLER
jgi:hypothetical protein